MPKDLLFEIGVEELPASFVDAALSALPGLAERRFAELRLEHGAIRAFGTPRRLALFVGAVAEKQADLDESVQGPPARVAFDAEGRPTPAAQAFAKKLGVDVAALGTVETEKGSYVVGRRRESGREAFELLSPALARIAGEIPFRKSMRWGDGAVAFGRPVRWLVALFGDDELPVEFAGLSASRISQGHRFLAPDAIELYQAEDYLSVLRDHHVVVDPEDRRRLMLERLHAAARSIGGELIEDPFLVAENSSLVEEPHVVIGSFDEAFLELPERVILEVAKGHQRYFGVREQNGRLLPRYLAVVGTALKPKNIVRGNDRVMRARLADAQFFYREDLRTPLQDRRSALDGVVFHKRLGTLGEKVTRLQRLAGLLGAMAEMQGTSLERAVLAASLCKNDLVTLMVGELPELQGEMGRAYALAQGVPAEVANALSEHYQPRGAEDAPPASDIGALVGLADRLDTLAGCFAIGLAPTGAADPLALRRAAIGLLKILLAKRWPLGMKALIEQAYDGFEGVKLDLDREACALRLGEFVQHRLRGVLQAS
ncbi:MAG TPA: glycine--tRNA ligase subunit beta, partial [Polyangiaceae bacterium]